MVSGGGEWGGRGQGGSWASERGFIGRNALINVCACIATASPGYSTVVIFSTGKNLTFTFTGLSPGVNKEKAHPSQR